MWKEINNNFVEKYKIERFTSGIVKLTIYLTDRSHNFIIRNDTWYDIEDIKTGEIYSLITPTIIDYETDSKIYYRTKLINKDEVCIFFIPTTALGDLV